MICRCCSRSETIISEILWSLYVRFVIHSNFSPLTPVCNSLWRRKLIILFYFILMSGKTFVSTIFFCIIESQTNVHWKSLPFWLHFKKLFFYPFWPPLTSFQRVGDGTYSLECSWTKEHLSKNLSSEYEFQ